MAERPSRRLRRGPVRGGPAEGDLDDVEDELFRFARVFEGIRRAARHADRRRPSRPPAASRSSRSSSAARRPTPPTGARLDGGRHRPGARPAPDRAVAGRDERHAPTARRWPRSAPRCPSPRTSARASPPRSSQATGKEVEVKVIVDPTVLGGLVTQIGDMVIDGTVRAPARPSCASALDLMPDDIADRLRRRRSHGRADHQHRGHRRRPREEPRGLPARHEPDAGRPGHRGRRRHRPRLGPARRGGERAARVRGRHLRPGAEPRRGVDRRGRARRGHPHRRGPDGPRHRPHPLRAGRRRPARPGRQRPGRAASTARARSPASTQRRMEIQAPGHHRPQAGARADADRHQGHRLR